MVHRRRTRRDDVYRQPDRIQEEAVQMGGVKKKPFDTSIFLTTEGPGRSIVHLAARQDFFSQGDPADSVFYLQTGRAKLTVASKKGREATVYAARRRGLFRRGVDGRSGNASNGLGLGHYRLYGAQIARDRILRVLHEEHAFSDFYLKFTVIRGMRTQADLVDQLFNSSERRLARALC